MELEALIPGIKRTKTNEVDEPKRKKRALS